jgi:hypothetical protein
MNDCDLVSSHPETKHMAALYIHADFSTASSKCNTKSSIVSQITGSASPSLQPDQQSQHMERAARKAQSEDRSFVHSHVSCYMANVRVMDETVRNWWAEDEAPIRRRKAEGT